jgi:hypothetical protein
MSKLPNVPSTDWGCGILTFLPKPAVCRFALSLPLLTYLPSFLRDQPSVTCFQLGSFQSRHVCIANGKQTLKSVKLQIPLELPNRNTGLLRLFVTYPSMSHSLIYVHAVSKMNESCSAPQEEDPLPCCCGSNKEGIAWQLLGGEKSPSKCELKRCK